LGSALIAHGEGTAARRLINRVISRGASGETAALARFNLALLAAVEDEPEIAVESLDRAASQHRSLALVPPRFALEGVLGRRGPRLDLRCMDHSTRDAIELELWTLPHVPGPAALERFHASVKSLARFE